MARIAQARRVLKRKEVMSEVGSEKRMLQESVKKKRQAALLVVAETRVGDAVSGSSVHFILWLIAIILCAIGRSLLARLWPVMLGVSLMSTGLLVIDVDLRASRYIPLAIGHLGSKFEFAAQMWRATRTSPYHFFVTSP